MFFLQLPIFLRELLAFRYTNADIDFEVMDTILLPLLNNFYQVIQKTELRSILLGE